VRLKSTFNTKKARLKKKKSSCLIKKIKSAFKSLKSLKMDKKNFVKSLKMKLLHKNIF
jgi:hypothetical protein